MKHEGFPQQPSKKRELPPASPEEIEAILEGLRQTEAKRGIVRSDEEGLSGVLREILERKEGEEA